MKKVAKLLITDSNDSYLMMYRDDHPVFGVDPDLPGGMLEDNETPLETMIREVDEEAGLRIDSLKIEQLYEGAEYSVHGTHFALFKVKFDERPDITLSWEHASYEWLDKDEFLKEAKRANDSYMHMVHDVVAKL